MSMNNALSYTANAEASKSPKECTKTNLDLFFSYTKYHESLYMEVFGRCIAIYGVLF